MSRKWIPNILTVLRIILSIPLFITLLISGCRGESAILPTCVILAMIMTDCLDGLLARRWGYDSMKGAYLDIGADILLALSSTLALSMNGTIHAAVFASMVIFAVQFPITARCLRHNTENIYDRLGRITGISCMAFPLAVILLENSPFPMTVGLCSGAIIAMCLASAISRIYMCIARRN